MELVSYRTIAYCYTKCHFRFRCVQCRSESHDTSQARVCILLCRLMCRVVKEMTIFEVLATILLVGSVLPCEAVV